MAINLSDVIAEIESRYNNIDSSTSALEQFRINSARDRLNNSGVYAQTYRSTGHLPTITDSAYLGNIAQVEVDNVFGDSDGAFYMATARDSGWVRMTTLQDSDEAAIEAPAAATVQLYYGGATAGYVYPGEPTSGNQIDKIVFASNTISTNVFTWPGQRSAMSGGQGETKGYAMAGYIPGQPGSSGRRTDIYSFPFANEDAFSDIGYDLAGSGIYSATGEAIGPADHTYAYIAGGEAWPGVVNVIGKFNTVVEAAGTDVGDLLAADYRNSAHSSATHGYVSTGYPASNVIEKWAFASDGNSTDVGDATEAEMDAQGVSSLDYGYITGGRPDVPATATNRVEKFSFASDGNATDALDLFQGRHSGVGISSEDHGYTAGGATGQLSPTGTNTVDRFPFASDDNATDVGNLSNSHHNIARAGCQV